MEGVETRGFDSPRFHHFEAEDVIFGGEDYRENTT